jgi:glucose/arabinose dehydrogenase
MLQRKFKKNIFVFVIGFISCFAYGLPLEKLKLPPGFTVSVYAQVEDARSLALAENGIIFVGNKEGDQVYAVIPNQNFSAATQVIPIAKDLVMPNGIAYYQGDLYVAEKTRILRFKNILQNLQQPPKPVIIFDQLPDKDQHGWRYLRIGPDQKIYVSVGAPCNICELDKFFGSILRMNLDGSHVEVFAKGIRNSVGFAWHPLTKQLWFTENGRDWLGDNLPPDELNIADKENENFGFPYYFGQNVKDPYFIKHPPAENFKKATYDLPAHVAALGMTFYTGSQFPEKYRQQIFIAEHGSWNRSSKVGFQVIMMKLDNNRAVTWEPFVSGWLNKQNAWGRPVDLLVMPDGALLISDDKNGVIYRVAYSGDASSDVTVNSEESRATRPESR